MADEQHEATEGSESDANALLSCPRCKRSEKDLERKSVGDYRCCIACKCGFHGPHSILGETAEFLWNEYGSRIADGNAALLLEA